MSVTSRRRLARLLAACAALLWLLVGTTLPPAAGAQTPVPQQDAVLVTAAATAEDLGPADPAVPAGGMALSFWLANQSGRDLAGVQLKAPVPARTRVANVATPPGSPAPAGPVPASGPGAPAGQGGPAPAITWAGLAVKQGQRLGPFGFRVVPAEGADGATIFHDATLQPEVNWTQPAPGKAAAPVLRLNGLWGEGGLRRTILPTGLTVFTRERPDSPTVALRLAVRAGSRDETDATSGGSHWLEHAHFLGTTRRPTDLDLSEAIDSVGGQSNASTGWEETNYWHLVPAEDFDLALDVLADQMLSSTFRPAAFDRERRVVFEELKRRFDTPGVRAFDEFINLVFQVSPLRRHPGGTIESVQAIPIETILAYRARLYHTGNMALAAVGSLRHDEAVAKIERAFAGLPRGSRSDRPRTPEPAQTRPRRLDTGDGDRLAEIAMGWPGPGDDDPDSPAMFILEDILGDTGRRLSEEIRDRRALATAVGPSYFDFNDAGAMMISASTELAHADEVVDLILAEIRRVRDGGVTDDDVQASRRAIAGRKALAEELNLAQSAWADAEVAGTLDSFAEYLARLRPVTAADVQRVARKYLDPANYTIVIVRL